MYRNKDDLIFSYTTKFLLFNAVLRIRFILIWIRILRSVSWNNGSGSCSKSDLKSGKYQLLCYFFFYKNIFLRNMICFVIYGVNIYVSKHNLIVLRKNMYDILMIFADFCWNFPWFWLIFCYPDRDPFHWSGSGSGWPKWNGSLRIRIRIRNTGLM